MRIEITCEYCQKEFRMNEIYTIIDGNLNRRVHIKCAQRKENDKARSSANALRDGKREKTSRYRPNERDS